MNRADTEYKKEDLQVRPTPWFTGLVRASGAYLTAAFAGGAVFMTFIAIGDIVSPSPYHAETPLWVMAANFVIGTFWVGTFGAVLLLLPFLLLLGMTKLLGLPRGWADALFGAAGCFLVSMAISYGRELTVSPAEVILALLLTWSALIPVLCGAIGGLTYWLVAGRPGRRSALPTD